MPFHSIPFHTRVSHGATNGATHMLARDNARAQRLLAGLHAHGPIALHARKQRGSPSGHAQPVHHEGSQPAPQNSIHVNDAGVTYTMPVAIGQPPTTYKLLIDTGSSNTWVGAAQKYTPTSTSVNTHKRVNVSYGSGSFTGTEYTDQVSLGGHLVIHNQSIGVASGATGFQGVDGILGIGPVDLTTGTVARTSSVPTVTDNLLSKGVITVEAIAISYTPSTSPSNIANGELTFGTTDRAKYTGSINYVPVTRRSPANKYWGIDQTLTYGTSTLLLKNSAGIVDTGTTMLLIATDAFQAYQRATGAVMDRATGLLTVTNAQYRNMQSLFFQIGFETYELIPNAQIWPRFLNSVIGGVAGKIYLVVSDLGSPSGSGLDFIDGFVFLQRFYSVYDTTNSRVGLATTQFTQATTN